MTGTPLHNFCEAMVAVSLGWALGSTKFSHRPILDRIVIWVGIASAVITHFVK